MTDEPKPLLRTRDKIVNYIADYAIDHHNAPSTREIAAYFGWSQTYVYKELMVLVQEKRLYIIDGKWKLNGAEYLPPET